MNSSIEPPSTSGTPLISVITPSFNQGAFIEETIQSVLGQDYPRIQHIVVDGGSTDETVEILKRYPHLLWVSERDRGQADALNKGLALARGDIVGWINSDDYYQPHAFRSVVAHFAQTGAHWVVGNLANVYDQGSSIRVRQSPKVTLGALLRDPDIVRQQSTFFRREALIEAGGWNAEFYMVMDFDLWTRLARLGDPAMVDEHWAVFRSHAAQKSVPANTLRQSREIARILRREHASATLIASHRLKKSWYWLKGVAKERLIDAGVVPVHYRARPLRQR